MIIQTTLSQESIQKVLKMAQISNNYIEAWGNGLPSNEIKVIELLASLGYDISSDEALLKSAAKQHRYPFYAFLKNENSKQRLHVERE